MRSVHFFIIAFLALVFTGCGDYWVIQRSESFVAGNNKGRKIISLSPQITFQAKEKNRDLALINKLQGNLYAGMSKYSKKNNINLKIEQLDAGSKTEYYEKLLVLRQNIVEVNFNDYSLVNSRGNGVENKLVKSVFIYPPKVSYDFNTWSKTFDTKYFSVLKVVISNESFTLYHVLVDTDLSETVYSERKTINHKFNNALLSQAVYDSFAALSKEL